MTGTATKVQKPKKVEAPKESGTRLVQDAVNRAMELAGGDFIEASKYLVNEAKRDLELHREITDGLLESACWDLLCKRAREERKFIFEAPNSDPRGQKGERVMHLARENALGLMDMPLPINGLPRLGDAIKTQVQEASGYYYSHAKDAVIKGKFLELVAKRLPDNTRVRDKFSENNLLKFQEEAKI